MLRDQGVELGHQLGVPAEHQVRLDALLDGGEPPLVQARALRLQRALVGEIAERRPRQSVSACRSSSAARSGSDRASAALPWLLSALKRWASSSSSLDVQHVAAARRGQAAVAERLAQRGDGVSADCRPPSAGGDSPHSASISRSLDTGSLA
jgi:hypothetical protein